MHWTLGRRRRQDESAVDAARRTARLTRLASAVALVSALAAVGGAVVAEVLDSEPSNPGSCTAVALTGYMYLYEDGTITHDEFEALRSDAIQDELEDTGDCTPASSRTVG